jgi:hypothetical protein
MHYAAYENADKTAAIMGHTRGVAIFFKFYPVPVETQEALEFFQITP